ncbi:MAG: hypothetical protein ACRCSF_01720 [Mycobacteriaceae bacterium]
MSKNWAWGWGFYAVTGLCYVIIFGLFVIPGELSSGGGFSRVAEDRILSAAGVAALLTAVIGYRIIRLSAASQLAKISLPLFIAISGMITLVTSIVDVTTGASGEQYGQLILLVLAALQFAVGWVGLWWFRVISPIRQ